MLAKIWKKLLLAICIIACIYNVMAKLVNRHSLEENLKKANDGEVVYELPGKNENTIENTTEAAQEKEVTNAIIESENTVNENSKQKSNSYFTFKFLH